VVGTKIKDIAARQILDSNGRPAIEVDVVTESGHLGRAGASTGSSVGQNESFVLRDGEPRVYGGMSVYKAISNVNTIIGPALIGMDVTDQEEIDRTMIELDGTRNKSRLGGNSIFAVSVAVARAAAAVKGLPLYRAMAVDGIKYIYTPASNVVNGGTYSGKTQAFQEFMILPHGVKSVDQGIRIIVEVFRRVGEVIANTNGCPPDVGNYSGWAAPSDDPLEILGMISEAVADLGYEKNVWYALDCASSHFYDRKEGAYFYRGQLVGKEEIIEVLATLAKQYPIAFIEDPLDEEDFEGFRSVKERVNAVIIGDDLICTNVDRARRAVDAGAIGGVIFKPNQVGTITEALETARYVMKQGMVVIPSGRAGGVLDSPEKEIGLAIGCPVVKSGAPRSGSRIAGFNFMLRVAEELDISMFDIEHSSYFTHLASSDV